MQMIDVLKRLAELDSANPQVATSTMKNEQSLATVSNIAGETINESISECGPMGMMGMGGTQSRTPATFSINATAADGAEVSSMLRDIMNLAGVKPVSDLPAFGGPKEIELEPVHALEPMDGGQSAGDEMSDLIGMVDRMNGDDGGKVGVEFDDGSETSVDLGNDDGMSVAQGDVNGDGKHDMRDHDLEKSNPVGKMADDVRDMANTLKDEGIGAGFDSATTTPNEAPANTPTGDKNNNKPKTGFTGAGNNNLSTAEGMFGFGKKPAADTGAYADGSSIKTPDGAEWKQQYDQAVKAANSAKTQQEYEAAWDRAGKIEKLLASKGIKVGSSLGQGMSEDVQSVAARLLKDYQAFINEAKTAK